MEQKKKPDWGEVFSKQRGKINDEIKTFLGLVLRFCVELEDDFHFTQDQIKQTISDNFSSLTKSLRQIHGFYGYPGVGIQTASSIGIDMDAFKSIVLEVEVENRNNPEMKFSHYFKITEEFNSNTEMPDLVREPAHIFLEMVRRMFRYNNNNNENDRNSSVIGRTFLKSLPDGKYLKPVAWAQHKTTKSILASLWVSILFSDRYIFT
ncbi:uncharacterized protein LOC114522681 [Dendronephthya gigantea]|uniref:uncharacterized protein LOC114522681 n=1 Tax=Dendronephthya gigantea TaxID=151771 RepID=UPI00106C83E4|nr:uncharacterized protein LOC114522681 [Dendronephthya gigantea]